MLLSQRKFNHDTEPAPHTIVQQNSQVILNNPNVCPECGGPKEIKEGCLGGSCVNPVCGHSECS